MNSACFASSSVILSKFGIIISITSLIASAVTFFAIPKTSLVIPSTISFVILDILDCDDDVLLIVVAGIDGLLN